jgi:hypothetical protein
VTDAGIDCLNIQFLENVGNDEVRGSHAFILSPQLHCERGALERRLFHLFGPALRPRLKCVKRTHVFPSLRAEVDLIRFTLLPRVVAHYRTLGEHGTRREKNRGIGKQRFPN